jgi:hypothetical protein
LIVAKDHHQKATCDVFARARFRNFVGNTPKKLRPLTMIETKKTHHIAALNSHQTLAPP